MPLREFRDTRGLEWRVWATTPDVMHLVTVREYGLGELQGGWLTFECGSERKRLAPFPDDWDMLSDAELELCCARAKAPPARKARPSPIPGARAPSGRMSAGESAPLDAVAPTRTLSELSGRLWRVAEYVFDEPNSETAGEHGAPTPAPGLSYVLRFTSENEVLELATYPMAWSRLPDADLLKLARHGERVNGGPNQSATTSASESSRGPR